MIASSTPARMTHSPATSAEAVFEAAFQEHYPRICQVLLRLLGDPALAEDIALETFWQLWQRPPAEAAERLGGWLYRVALRLGYNALRSQRRRTRYEFQAGEAVLREVPPTPELEVEAALERERARMVLQALPPREAQLLLLRYSGLSYKEIAHALGLAPTSIGTLLARAEKSFQARYQRGG